MKKLYLPQTQIGAEVVRVPQGLLRINHLQSIGYHIHFAGIFGEHAKFDINKGYDVDSFKPPFQPGEIVYVPETWREVYASGSELHGYKVGIDYKALPRNTPPKIFSVDKMHYGARQTDDGGMIWNSPATMPAWAARHFARIVEVGAELTEDKWTWVLRLEWVDREGR